MSWTQFAVLTAIALTMDGPIPAPAYAQCSEDQAWDAAGDRCVVVVHYAKFRWPAAGLVILSCGKGHNAGEGGISLALRPGSDIRAAESGRVAYAGDELKGFAEVILIRHDDDWVSAYALNGTILVETGNIVGRGQLIARADRTDTFGRNRLRFELRRHSVSVKPLDYLDRDSSHTVSETFCAN